MSAIKRRVALLGVLLLAGCAGDVPMERPAILDATPGPAVQLNANTYTSAAFSVWYPPDWQVTSSATFAAPWVAMSSPAGDAVIMIAVDAQDTADIAPPAATAPRRQQMTAQTDNGAVTVVYIAESDQFDVYIPLLNRVIASIA